MTDYGTQRKYPAYRNDEYRPGSDRGKQRLTTKLATKTGAERAARATVLLNRQGRTLHSSALRCCAGGYVVSSAALPRSVV